MGEERLHLRRERQAVVVAIEEQRLLAGAVAGQQQTPLAGVPEREREHPFELVDERVAFLFVQMDDDFGVGVRAETVTGRHQAIANRA